MQKRDNKNQKKSFSRDGQNKKNGFSRNKDRIVDASHQQDFIFNKTPILASALKKLKAKSSNSNPKASKRSQPIQIQESKTSKKVKRNLQDMLPTLTYTPLQRDLYNFYTINKSALKNFQSVPQPKFQVGSTVLSALCDRGIGGKFLVSNIFRNKKCYIDFKEVSLFTNQKQNSDILQKYDEAGQFVIGTVVKGRSPTHIQLSMSTFLTIDEKFIKIGQTFPAQIKSKQQLGCHLSVYGLQKYKVFLPKSNVSEDQFQNFVQDKQIIVVVKEIQENKNIIKVTLANQEEIPMNFKGLEEDDLSKMELDQYVSPGTLLNTKIIKVLKNGVMVKFLKIFIGFIHSDHLSKHLESYAVGEKLLGRVIFYCINPPTIFLSQKHVNLSVYEPKRELFSDLLKPSHLQQRQNAFFNKQQQIFIHPAQFGENLNGISKLYAKQNNYFQRYQIMSSKKIGVQVGEVSKIVPFTNFKIYGEKQNKQGHKFRVMCLDLWNKVIKISYDQKIIKANQQQLLFDTQDVQDKIKYIGFITGVNPNGVVIQFCNNIKGIISKNQLKIAQIDITTQNIGQSFEVFVFKVKKGYLGLTLRHPDMRNDGKTKKTQNKNNQQATDGQSTQMGTIQSINRKSIYPIYVKLKSKFAKISIFNGIRSPSISQAHIIQNLQDHYQVGQNVRVFRKGSSYFLYPPEQLRDKCLRYCRVLGIKNTSLRIQTNDKQFFNCHISNITDIITPYPLSQYKVGQYTIGRLIDDKEICLRKSIVKDGIPKSMQECIKRYQEEEKKGDLRNRLLTIGSSALKTDMVAFGYIKTFGEKGCFVSLSHNYQVRVERCQLSDIFLKDKDKQFKTNKLVLCRLISSKVKNNEPSKVFFEASLRESVIKHGYPINDEVLEHGVGLTVQGTIKGYTKGKALVTLHSSKFTGIIDMKDIQNLGDQSIEKALPIGKTLKFKIIEYSFDGEKRLIRLSNLQKYINKYKDFETKFPADARIVSLWQNFKALSDFQMPQIQKEINLQEENPEDQEKRILGMLGGLQNDEDNQDEENNQQAEQDQQQELEQDNQMIDQDDEDQDDNEEMIDQNQQDQDEQVEQSKSNHQSISHTKTEVQQIKSRSQMFEKMPHQPSFYQSLVLANPTPQSWLMYISSLLSSSTAQQIRVQFLKAINSFSDVKQKDNMWISWINMEIILGDLEATVKKAIQNNVGIIVYFRILEILTEKEQWDVAIQFGRKMLKKFNRDIKAYIHFLKMIHQYGQNHQINQSVAPKQILRRASQCLKSHQVITIESHMAKNLFQANEAQKGRNIFQQLLSKHPKRTDLWSMYIDMQVKSKQVDRARNLLERILSLSLNKKQVKSNLKKYYLLEQQFGTEKSAKAVLQRAKKFAQQFQTTENVALNDQDSDEQ